MTLMTTPTTTAALALLTTLALPVNAWAMTPREALRTFCTAVREINAAGVPVSPGTPGSYRIASQAQINDSTYRRLWNMASTSSEPSCRGIF